MTLCDLIESFDVKKHPTLRKTLLAALELVPYEATFFLEKDLLAWTRSLAAAGLISDSDALYYADMLRTRTIVLMSEDWFEVLS